MNSVLTRVVFLLVSVAVSIPSFAAVKIVECEDEDGNRSFQKTCPPGSRQLYEKKISTGTRSADEDAAAVDIEATLYLIPDCEACEEVKEFLSARNIPVTEKNVSEDIALQGELTDLTGALQVPTTVIGDEVLTGYSRSSFLEALKKAGFSEEES